MALGTAFINVILRLEATRALDARGRWIARQAFQWRKNWFRFDDHLMATLFLVPKDVRAFCTWLEGRTGLVRGRDYAVWDAALPSPQKVPWLEGDVDPTAILACVSTTPRTASFPSRWRRATLPKLGVTDSSSSTAARGAA
jgi:hypothetical protein